MLTLLLQIATLAVAPLLFATALHTSGSCLSFWSLSYAGVAVLGVLMHKWPTFHKKLVKMRLMK